MKAKEVFYICADCANENGGVWPKSHVATFHLSDCDACDNEKSLCHVSDYNWPNGAPKGWCYGGLWD